MGMYTELIFGASLKSETPWAVINTLRYMMGDLKEYPGSLWTEDRNPFRGGSYYFGVSEPVRHMWYDSIGNQWKISTRANIKNYNNEIEKFLDWIKPHIDSGSGTREFYAVVTYEEAAEPTIYYLCEANESE